MEGCKFLSVWHHTAKALQIWLDKGHWKDVHSVASKQAKVFMAEEYFPQVDLDTDALISFETALGEMLVEVPVPCPITSPEFMTD